MYVEKSAFLSVSFYRNVRRLKWRWNHQHAQNSKHFEIRRTLWQHETDVIDVWPVITSKFMSNQVTSMTRDAMTHILVSRSQTESTLPSCWTVATLTSHWLQRQDIGRHRSPAVTGVLYWAPFYRRSATSPAAYHTCCQSARPGFTIDKTSSSPFANSLQCDSCSVSVGVGTPLIARLDLPQKHGHSYFNTNSTNINRFTQIFHCFNHKNLYAPRRNQISTTLNSVFYIVLFVCSSVTDTVLRLHRACETVKTHLRSTRHRESSSPH